MRICETLGEDLQEFASIHVTLGENLQGFMQDFGRDLEDS